MNEGAHRAASPTLWLLSIMIGACSSDPSGSGEHRGGEDAGTGGATAADGSPGSGGHSHADGAPTNSTGGSRTGDAGDGGEPNGAAPGDAGTQGPPTCTGAVTRFATSVVESSFGPGQSAGQGLLPGIVTGPPRGGGCCQGSTDTVSLGNGGTITLAFAGNAILDGPGADFIVFENAFAIGGDVQNPFAELATVAVSDDGVSWEEFPCTASASPYGSCAGWRPVHANADTNVIDPTDPGVAGGDAFDLADLGLPRARLVRITDRVDLTGTAGVADIDAVAIVNAACP